MDNIFKVGYDLYKKDMIKYSVDIFSRFLDYDQFKIDKRIYDPYIERAKIKIRNDKLKKIKGKYDNK